MPITGISPFMSYGSSFMMVNLYHGGYDRIGVDPQHGKRKR